MTESRLGKENAAMQNRNSIEYRPVPLPHGGWVWPLLAVAMAASSAVPASTPSACDTSAQTATTVSEDIPLFAANSPFDEEHAVPVIKKGKRLWARSWRWAKAPDLVVEKWLDGEPKTQGKYVLVEFWATWCGPCRRAIPLLNGLHEKYGKELVVVGISDETEEDVRNMAKSNTGAPKIQYHRAIDTQARMKKEVGVFGIPHAMILEPGGYVVWEGFPLLEGYELSDEIVEKILDVGRKLKAKAATGR